MINDQKFVEESVGRRKREEYREYIARIVTHQKIFTTVPNWNPMTLPSRRNTRVIGAKLELEFSSRWIWDEARAFSWKSHAGASRNVFTRREWRQRRNRSCKVNRKNTNPTTTGAILSHLASVKLPGSPVIPSSLPSSPFLFPASSRYPERIQNKGRRRRTDCKWEGQTTGRIRERQCEQSVPREKGREGGRGKTERNCSAPKVLSESR